MADGEFKKTFVPSETVDVTMKSVLDDNSVLLQKNFEGEADYPAEFRANSQWMSNLTEGVLKILDQTGRTDTWFEVFDFINQEVVINDAQITGQKIDTETITSTNLASLSVETGKIVDLAVTGAKIALLAVGTSHLASQAVSSVKIQDEAIIESKIATDAVSETKIAVGAVTGLRIASGAVTTEKLGALAVDSSKLGNGAVTTAKIAVGAVDTDQLASDSVAGGKIKPYAVIANRISDDARKPSLVLDQEIQPVGCSLRSGALPNFPEELFAHLPDFGKCTIYNDFSVLFTGKIYVPRKGKYLNVSVKRQTMFFRITINGLSQSGGAGTGWQTVQLDLSSIDPGAEYDYVIDAVGVNPTEPYGAALGVNLFWSST